MLIRTPSSSGASPACPDPHAWLCIGLGVGWGKEPELHMWAHEPNGAGVCEVNSWLRWNIHWPLSSVRAGTWLSLIQPRNAELLQCAGPVLNLGT